MGVFSRRNAFKRLKSVFRVRLQKTLENPHLDIGSQHNCFGNSFQYGFTGATFQVLQPHAGIDFWPWSEAGHQEGFAQVLYSVTEMPCPYPDLAPVFNLAEVLGSQQKAAGNSPGLETESALLT